jgi:hypothetical protein
VWNPLSTVVEKNLHHRGHRGAQGKTHRERSYSWKSS